MKMEEDLISKLSLSKPLSLFVSEDLNNNIRTYKGKVFIPSKINIYIDNLLTLAKYFLSNKQLNN